MNNKTENWQERTILQIGEENIKKLNTSHVLVAGLGGVGSYTVEMLCRTGVGELTIIDFDTIHPSNKNRQLHALNSTIGRKKTEVVSERLMDINPDLKLHVIDEYLKDDKIPEILNKQYDYIVDAIDTLSPKIYLIYNALKKNLPIVSSMGAGGKYDPSLIRISDISDSYNCPLARILRKRLHKLGIRSGFKVVFSPEEISEKSTILIKDEPNKRSIVGSISYMTAIFGCFCAYEAVSYLLKNTNSKLLNNS